MANWYQRKPSDDAKIIMLLRLGKVELAIAALELCQHHCEQETDDIPIGVEPHMRELQALALVPSVDDMLRSLKTKRRNRGGTTWHHVEPDKRREEQKREETGSPFGAIRSHRSTERVRPVHAGKVMRMGWSRFQ